MPYYPGMINPATGNPYLNQADYDSWNAPPASSGQRGDPAVTQFNDEHNTGYKFGPSTWANDTSPNGGYIFFGDSSGGDKKAYIDIHNPFRKLTAQDLYQGGMGVAGLDKLQAAGIYQVAASGGYIDPKTGDIVYGTGVGANGSTWGNNDPNAPTIARKKYYYGQDYGLGSAALGVIPIQFDRKGTPVKFYAGTPGGGGQIFSDLASAMTSVAAYKKWYDEKYPQGTPGTQIAPTPTPSGQAPSAPPPPAAKPDPRNDLTVPGAGEDYYDSTKPFYTQPTKTSQVQSGLVWDPTQPTNAQQHWNGIAGAYNDPNHRTDEQNLWNAQSGQFLDPNHKTDAQSLWSQWASMYSDPSYLDAMYKRAEDAAQTTLDRKSSSGGWGDSGAAARATGNLGVAFADAKRKGYEDWSNTGMGLAGAADASGNAWLNTGLGLAKSSDDSQNIWANTGATIAQGADAANVNQKNAIVAGNLGQVSAAQAADSADLARITGGQTSANSAEADLINRANADIGAATTIGGAEASIAATGLGAAEQSKLQLWLAAESAKMTAGTLTAQQAYQEAQAYLTALGVTGKALSTILGNLGTKKTDGSNKYFYET